MTKTVLNIYETAILLDQQHQELKAELTNLFLDQPDNPNIKRIPGSVNCFTISSKEVFNSTHNLSPRYYDFKLMYKMIAEKLDSMLIMDAVHELSNVIRSKSITINTKSLRGTFAIHPDMILNLKKLTNFKDKVRPS